ncbi:hypothetical protein PPN31114_02506 [Pandoraea pneumonica]|jgi:hypothetical protein|uniref:DUF2946 domain-containing protein n=1 Tax=Pandoraea pneumonica TaxID=2508299 RepID=A0A5E4V9T6_9BURK|nr:hypothetical protein [Pandoraea pneumonica]VVE08344.1 hypothetical protein PPN31114_02506 [Pandoraea pneumonica]
MNRWRKLLVLWLLCVTMPLQAMAALRTHCAPDATVATLARLAVPMATLTLGMSHSDATMQHAMHGGHHDAMAGSDGAHDMTLHASSHDSAPDTADKSASHSQHASCSACAACVVCTALPQSLAIRTPDAQPSAAIPFLRTSAASAFVATLERPPKAVLV